MARKSNHPDSAALLAVRQLGGTAAVARRCGVDISTVQKWLRRGSIPSLREALIIADASGVDIRDLTPPEPADVSPGK